MAGKRILIIDDDSIQIDLLSSFLKQQNFEVFIAMDGNNGIYLAGKTKPDLVLLDLYLPGIDGHTVCKRLREMTDSPVIFLSGTTDEEEIVRGFREGADDFIIKPIKYNELLERIDLRMRMHKPHPQINHYRDKDLQVDVHKKKVFHHGRAIHLTPLEFKLLVCLVRHSGEVVSHKEILQEVWGHCYRDAVTNLSLYIHYLRQKLEDDPHAPVYIQNDWGNGYWFKAMEEQAEPPWPANALLGS